MGKVLCFIFTLAAAPAFAASQEQLRAMSDDELAGKLADCPQHRVTSLVAGGQVEYEPGYADCPDAGKEYVLRNMHKQRNAQ